MRYEVKGTLNPRSTPSSPFSSNFLPFDPFHLEHYYWSSDGFEVVWRDVMTVDNAPRQPFLILPWDLIEGKAIRLDNLVPVVFWHT
jgi:hypothetical protein